MQKAYVFEKVQSGYWGATPLDKKAVVKAASELEARAKIRQRKDFIKTLRNGDTVSWRLIPDT